MCFVFGKLNGVFWLHLRVVYCLCLFEFVYFGVNLIELCVGYVVNFVMLVFLLALWDLFDYSCGGWLFVIFCGIIIVLFVWMFVLWFIVYYLLFAWVGCYSYLFG